MTDTDSTVSPSDAIPDTDDAADAVDTAADAADGDSESSVSVSEMLLSTEPDESPQSDHADKPEHVAHGLIGAKKMLSAAGTTVESGTPAILNIGMAAIGFFSGDEADDGGDQEDSSQPSSEPQPATV
jgi:hypothetical protein